MNNSYIHRNIENILASAAKQFPAVILTGPRQSGKTTLLKHLFSHSHKYVSMDSPDLRVMAANDPEIFFQNYQPPLIIDEIQYVPQLFSYIKVLIDQKRNLKGQFLLTGSQNFPLMTKTAESLAGRTAVLSLLPFSIKERLAADTIFDINTLKKMILTGGFPEIVTSEDLNTELWFASYLQTYLERDVRQLRQIGDLTDFQRFLQLISAFNGQELKLSKLSNDLGIAVNTVKAWISILETSGQIVLIKPFYKNKGKRIIKSPKLYFLDTGLLCFLSGINSTKQIFTGAFSGQMLETIIVGEIIKTFYNNGKIPQVYWWRTSHGDEVDFIVEHNGRITPIEIKLSSNATAEMLKGLTSFCEIFKAQIDHALLLNLSEKQLILGNNIISMPVYDFIRKWKV